MNNLSPIRPFTILFCLFGHAYSTEFNGTCEAKEPLSIPAYAHWPFRVDCDHLREIWMDSAVTDGSLLKCDVFYNGARYEEGVFELSDTKDLTIYQTQLIINSTFCISSDVNIDLRPFPEGSCVDALNEAASRDEIIYREATAGDPVQLRCIPPEGSPAIIPKGTNAADFTTRWFTRCIDESYRDNNLWTELPDEDGYPNKLNMPTVDFYDATNFTCTVTYAGRTLYVRTYAQCVKQKTKHTEPTITCTSEETEAPGKTVTLDCTGQIVMGITSSEDFIVEWEKDGKVICSNQFFNQTRRGYLDRQSCTAEDETKNQSVVCVADGYSIPDEEIQNERKSIDTYLAIRNIESSDYGTYKVNLKIRQYGLWTSDTWTVKLNEDLTPFYERLVLILGSVLAVLVVFILAGLLIKRYQIYILLAIKRSRLRKYDEDDKDYVVYLSYHYDGGNDTERNLQATEKIVCAIHNLLDTKGYKYYDEQKQTDFAAQVETITNLVERCHRMVIVLTTEYLEDNWKRFHAELGVHGVLNSRIGLVLILTPGAMKMLKTRAKSDRVWDRLLVAIKTNRVIKWNEAMSDDKLKAHVEYLLPKLERRSRPHNLSVASSEDVGCVQNSYNRSLSQTTACTNLSTDAEPTDIAI